MLDREECARLCRLVWLCEREASENVEPMLVKGFMAAWKSPCVFRLAWLPLCTYVPASATCALGTPGALPRSGLPDRELAREDRREGKREPCLEPAELDGSGGVRLGGVTREWVRGALTAGASGASLLKLRSNSVLTHSRGCVPGPGS